MQSISNKGQEDEGRHMRTQFSSSFLFSIDCCVPVLCMYMCVLVYVCEMREGCMPQHVRESQKTTYRLVSILYLYVGSTG